MFREELARHSAFLPSLSEEVVAALERHFDLLLRWNRALNLSAVRSGPEIVERHYCESLFLAANLPAGRLTIADLGSGAGFPGIPVAVLRPDCRITLIESHRRKAVFLREATRGMENVEVLARRAEESEGVRFDWVVSRAVKFETISDWVRKSAGFVALLSGGERVESGVESGGFRWSDGSRLPWGDRSFLNIGRNVSRETFAR
ncbi:MAG: 16S rRNA (guanine(527)-N(7))-methyltransferase RsmG [Acidobacteriota bacterium]|nr:16S rRNA (guanine(527)-N(7))-methyltransferase RsmG [Acidobacteriota bacterium]